MQVICKYTPDVSKAMLRYFAVADVCSCTGRRQDKRAEGKAFLRPIDCGILNHWSNYRAKAAAALVALETEELQGSFSENAFTMMPWQDHPVLFQRHHAGGPSEPLTKEALRRDINIFSLQKAMAQRETKRKLPRGV